MSSIIERKRDRQAELKDARHRFARVNPLVGEGREGGDVVGEQDSLMLGGPLENAWVIGARETDILDANQIDAGLAEPDASNDVIVEVLIGEQADHAESCPV
jgi:hypothetical protein